MSLVVVTKNNRFSSYGLVPKDASFTNANVFNNFVAGDITSTTNKTEHLIANKITVSELEVKTLVVNGTQIDGSGGGGGGGGNVVLPGSANSIVTIDSDGKLQTSNGTITQSGDLLIPGSAGIGGNTTIYQNLNVVGNITAANFSGDVTLTPVGVAPNANAASLAGQILTLQPADATNPGVVTATGTQTFGGNKIFSAPVIAMTGDLNVTGNITAANLSADVTLAPVGVAPNANAATMAPGQVLNLEPADATNPGVVTATGTQTFGGNKIFSAPVIAMTGDLNVTGNITAANLSGDVTLAPVGVVPNANAATITAQVLNLEPADATNPGVVTAAGTQTLGGNKIIVGTLAAANLSGTNTGDATLAVVGAAPNASGASLVGQVLTLQPANGTNPGLVTAGTQTLGGDKTFTGAIAMSSTLNVTGNVTAANISGTNTGNVTLTAVGVAPNANAASLAGQALTLQPADATNPGIVSTTTQSLLGNKTIVGNLAATNLSGTNTGNVTLAVVGAAPNANAASIAGQVLTLQPANATNPGLVTAGTQTFGGDKTFNGAIAMGSTLNVTGNITAANFSGSNTGDVTLAAVGAVPNANAASLVGQQLTLQPANATNPGVVTTGTQTLAGDKTFTGNITAPNISGSNTGDVTLATVGAVPNANAASLVGQQLTLQPADATNPGVVTAGPGTQTLAGDKTFTGAILMGSTLGVTGNITAANLSGTNTGNVTLTAVGAAPNANAASLAGQALTLQPADATNPGVVSTTTQSFLGNKTIVGNLAATNLSGTNTGNVTLTAAGAVPNASAASLVGQALTLQPADATNPGIVSTTTQSFLGNKTIVGNLAATNLSGTNTGNVTLAAVGAAPNANAASLVGQVLTLQPADATNPGVVTAGPGAQTFAGDKTFAGAVTMDTTLDVTGNITAANFSGSNTGDVTLAAVGAAPNANAASLVGQVLTLQPANVTNPGVVTTGVQVFAGDKTFAGAVTMDTTLDVTGAVTMDTTLDVTGNITAANFSGSNTGDVTLTAVGATPNANGASLAGQALTLQPADATNPGLVSTTTQTFLGDKTISGNLAATNLSGTNTGNVTLTAVGAVPNVNGASLVGQALTLQPADATNPGLVSTTTQTFLGDKTISGNLAATNLSGTNTGNVTLAAVGVVPNANGASLAGQVLTLQPASSTQPGVLTAASQSVGGQKIFGTGITTATLGVTGNASVTGTFLVSSGTTLSTFLGVGTNITAGGTIVGSNLSGTNTGDVTLAVAGNTPNANAASLTGQELTLQPADATNPGIVTTGTQTFGGDKTVSGNLTATNLSGTNTGNVTLGAVGASPNGNAASLADQVLTLQPANATNPGVVTTGAQVFAGDKTFNGAIAMATTLAVTGNITGANLSGTNTGNVTLTAVGAVPNANAASLVGQALTLQPANVTNPGVVSTTTQTFLGDKTISGNLAATNLSGTNTGNVTLTAVGAVPNANGASLVGQALTLQPANATNPGLVTIAAQTFAGVKTFSSTIDAPTNGIRLGNTIRLTNNTAVPLPTLTTTLITFDTLVYNSGITYSAGTFTLPIAGTYIANWTARIGTPAAAEMDMVFIQTPSDSIMAGNQPFGPFTGYQTTSAVFRTTGANQTISANIYNGGSANTITGGNPSYNFITIQLISAT